MPQYHAIHAHTLREKNERGARAGDTAKRRLGALSYLGSSLACQFLGIQLREINQSDVKIYIFNFIFFQKIVVPSSSSMCAHGLHNLAAILYNRAVPASNTAKRRLGALFYPGFSFACQFLGIQLREINQSDINIYIFNFIFFYRKLLLILLPQCVRMVCAILRQYCHITGHCPARSPRSFFSLNVYAVCAILRQYCHTTGHCPARSPRWRYSEATSWRAFLSGFRFRLSASRINRRAN